MLQSVKPMIVVLALALIVFALAKPICLRFMDLQDYRRRTRVWLVLTAVMFFSPSLWIFAGVALPLIYWAAKVDSNPTALYVMLLLIVPPISLPIPMPVINQLFELTYFRILSLAVLLPTLFRIVHAGRSNPPGLAKVDLMLLAFGLLQLVVYLPYESITNTMRRTFLFFVDTYALYFVFSRGTTTRESIRDTMATYWLAIVVLVPITMFESVKGWLLYQSIPDNWGSASPFTFLMRGDSLRAQGSGGHSLTMGFMFAIAFGFWLYLSKSVESKRTRWVVGVALWMGLFAAFSRAPWLVGALVGLLFLLATPSGRRSLPKVALILIVLALPFSLTPQGARIVESLPFVGTLDQGNVDYRQQLASLSWQLIQLNPFFGDPFATNYMEELRQGQGIIDIVNTYASVSLFYGLVGCALFVGCFVYPMLRTLRAALLAYRLDEDRADLGMALVACVCGTLLMMATCGFGIGFEQTGWILAGLCGAYTVGWAERAASQAAEPAARGLRHPPRQPQT